MHIFMYQLRLFLDSCQFCPFLVLFLHIADTVHECCQERPHESCSGNSRVHAMYKPPK